MEGDEEERKNEEELTDAEILRAAWPHKPQLNTLSSWVFLSVDVIRHSRLFEEHMEPAALQTSHKLLSSLRKTVKESIPDCEKDSDMEWDWAGDGGIFAFPVPFLEMNTTRKAVLVADNIWQGLKALNQKQQDLTLRMQVRMVLTQGQAFYYEEQALRCGSALNLVAKLRVPDERSSITITSSVFSGLQNCLKQKFRLVDRSESVRTTAPESAATRSTNNWTISSRRYHLDADGEGSL